jgi:hypothetical protein
MRFEMKPFPLIQQFRVSTLAMLLFGMAGEAVAVLGQSPASAPSVAGQAPAAQGLPALTASPAKQRAVSPSAQSPLYTVHETQLESGTLVKEYASADGIVFAISWKGPVLPNLKELLGSYFSVFEVETVQARVNGRRGSPVAINRDGLVVSSNGRMGLFFGSAFALALVPANLSIQDVLQ